MKELGDILGVLRRATEPVVLVTVVAVEGSTYRRPGARMLVLPGETDGRIGSISGGCLEDEVCRRAWYLTENGPVVVTYETGLDDGPGPGYTLGCGGRVTVLFERIDPRAIPAYLSFVEQCRAAGRAAAIATVISSGSATGPRVGERLVTATEGQVSVANQSWDSLNADILAALDESRSRRVAIDAPQGRVDVAIEFVPPPVHLLVHGTGHDAEPLVSLAARLGWRVTVVARKLTPGVRARFASADEVIPASAGTTSAPTARAAAIIMNHNYAQDVDALAGILASSVPYIGILGPRHRTDTMLSDIAARGTSAATSQLDRIHAPIGLDIGAETPEEVALAIVAEIQAFFAIRPGGPLRDRNGAIHTPAGASAVSGSHTVEVACALDART